VPAKKRKTSESPSPSKSKAKPKPKTGSGQGARSNGRASTKTNTSRPNSLFAPIQQPRAHDYVYEQLSRHIGLGLIGVGEPLPTERDLATTFGVGRTTIQRAIGMLEEQHLVETRRGRLGGTFVLGQRSDENGLGRLLAELRETSKQVGDALVLRRVAEGATAQIAAEEATEAELAEMEASIERMTTADTELGFHRYDTEFHLQVAHSTHNSLLYETVERSRLLLNNAILVLPESTLWHARIEREHQAIIDAVRGGDGEAAKRLMGEHLQHTEMSIRAMLIAL
jgi:DNA-binding FadR family transcriptional regulator